MFVIPVARRSAELSRHVDRLLDAALEPLFSARSSDDGEAARSPAIDVAETDAALIVTLDMPGVIKEDVQVSIEGRRLNVQASVRKAAPQEGEAATPKLLYRERAQTRYARSVALPKAVDQAQAVAKLENGVLVLTLPKPVATQAAKITVN
jgi:HSP20 family protein